ncbi:hypothetical protein FZO89_06535 [Luteimonas viscosa]|uniref:DUF4239 domain-containing protein n=1 Tax=Luteimonas viscosa TaxID=1132694 RepID=A0A5D4XMR5_9GAMM|nr:hypothetical protein [Luteimonas viscosa]TYT25936.1 hypothetical protein FZO89_06535 [Luteimonas viscosa]
MTRYLLEAMPIAGVYVCIVLLILAACETGILFGRHHLRIRQDEGAQTSVGPVVGGLLGMLAFLLAFTFSMASTHHGARKQDVLTEATRIGATHLRADLLGDERGREIKRLLREYVDVRLDAVRPGGDLQAGLERSLQIHAQLWAQASSSARDSPGQGAGRMVESVIELIAIHERRFADGVRARIPHGIWLGLAAIAALTMGTLGLQVGLTGKRRLVGIVPIALTFALLVTLIVDLNRPQGGLITVDQQPLADLQRRLQTAAVQAADPSVTARNPP